MIPSFFIFLIQSHNDHLEIKEGRIDVFGLVKRDAVALRLVDALGTGQINKM